MEQEHQSLHVSAVALARLSAPRRTAVMIWRLKIVGGHGGERLWKEGIGVRGRLRDESAGAWQRVTASRASASHAVTDHPVIAAGLFSPAWFRMEEVSLVAQA